VHLLLQLVSLLLQVLDFQYYRVTDKNNIDEKEILDIKEQIDQSLKVATAHGSLVLNPTSDRDTAPSLSINVVPPVKPNVWAEETTKLSAFVQ
jgi:hypothetical protein